MANPAEVQALVDALKQSAIAPVWLRGLNLSRQSRVSVESHDGQEWKLSVFIPGRAVSLQVTFWFDGPEWHCDCGERTDPCAHVVAAALTLKQSRVEMLGKSSNRDLYLGYRFQVAGPELVLDRFLTKDIEGFTVEKRLEGSLASVVGGIRSGRIHLPPIVATQSDFAVDAAIGPSPPASRPSRIDLRQMRLILEALVQKPRIFLGETQVAVAAQAITDLANKLEEPTRFQNGAALSGQVLTAWAPPQASPRTSLKTSIAEPRSMSHMTSEILHKIASWAPSERNSATPISFLGTIIPHWDLEAGLLRFEVEGESVPYETLDLSWEKRDSLVRLSPGRVAELPGEWLENEAILKLRAALVSEPILQNVHLPPKLKAELRPYQLQGLRWLQFMRRAGLGALLADDMGLGKTIQALTALESPALVIAPASAMSAWEEQIARFLPEMTFSRYHGTSRTLTDAQVTLTTYATARLDSEVLGARNWATVILDEAQNIKNPYSQAAQACHSLKAGFRIALTGTPIENRVEDLWSIFRFINPSLLDPLRDFERACQLTQGLERVRRQTRPFTLRRLKGEVAPELPPRTEVMIRTELNSEENEAYAALYAVARTEAAALSAKETNLFSFLEKLLRLRQACCHVGLLPGRAARETPSKIEALFESLEEAVSCGHKALIFSQWTSFLDLVEPELRSRAIPFGRLDGSTKDRGAVVDSFQALGGPPVLLLSLKAGGTALTLTAADHVYLLDPWWNPAAEEQAFDRAHRIGQTQPVFIHKLVAKNTIEDRIEALKEKKRAIARAALGATDAPFESLTREELLGLLG